MKEHRHVMRLYPIENRRFQKATSRYTARLKGIRLDGQRVWTRSRLAAVLRRKAA